MLAIDGLLEDLGATAVPRGTVWSPFNQPGGTVEEIIDATAPVTDVRIERI